LQNTGQQAVAPYIQLHIFREHLHHLDELVRDEATLPAGQSLAQRIVLEAVEKSGRDNATALVFDFRGAPPSSGVTPT
jgi:hypothetical protein